MRCNDMVRSMYRVVEEASRSKLALRQEKQEARPSLKIAAALRQDLSSRELRLDFSLMQTCLERELSKTRHLCRLLSPMFAMNVVLPSPRCLVIHLCHETSHADSLPEAPPSTRLRGIPCHHQNFLHPQDLCHGISMVGAIQGTGQSNWAAQYVSQKPIGDQKALRWITTKEWEA